jgi:hypothetical protein
MIDMRRFTGLAAVMLLASTARAQDTTVVVVRHIAPQQDTSVVVRHLAPPPQQRRTASPRGIPRYPPGSTAVVAKDPNVGTMLSLVFPGGGQYYAGNQAKGLAITLIGIGAPIIGFANVRREHGFYDSGFGPGLTSCDVGVLPAVYYSPGPSCRGRYDWTPAAIGLGVGITAWLYGVATAGSDVQHWNQAHGVRFVTAPGRVGFAVAVP